MLSDASTFIGFIIAIGENNLFLSLVLTMLIESAAAHYSENEILELDHAAHHEHAHREHDHAHPQPDKSQRAGDQRQQIGR